MLRFISRTTIALAGCVAAAAAQAGVQRYEGMCDASAVVSLADGRFVVANDEDNFLRVYRIGQPKPLSQDLDLTQFLASSAGEVDIEGAARFGCRIYWITSHGANKSGKPRPERRRFFATDIVTKGKDIRLVPVGQPYLDLVADLSRLDATNRFDFPSRSQKAPEADGINVEGLVPRPDGTILLAFRSPVVGGKATLVPITNPAEIVSGAPAKLGTPISLALEGFGIRSIESLPDNQGYVISAGPVANGALKLFFWDGKSPTGRLLPVGVGDLSPEAIAIEDGTSDRFLLLSDDGDELIDGKPCKESVSSKSFRGVKVTLPRVGVR